MLLCVLAACGGDVSRQGEADALAHDLAETNVVARRDAAKSLHDDPLLAALAVNPLAAALEDSDRWVREWAARALGKAGASATPAVPALTRAVNDEDSFVRYRASQALARIGAGAAPALPTLDAAAADEDETEIGRHWAKQAARRIREALGTPGGESRD